MTKHDVNKCEDVTCYICRERDSTDYEPPHQLVHQADEYDEYLANTL